MLSLRLDYPCLYERLHGWLDVGLAHAEEAGRRARVKDRVRCQDLEQTHELLSLRAVSPESQLVRIESTSATSSLAFLTARSDASAKASTIGPASPSR